MVKMHSDLLTISEVARLLRVDDTTVRRWIQSGALDAVLLPGRGQRKTHRIKSTTLENLLQEELILQEEELVF